MLIKFRIILLLYFTITGAKSLISSKDCVLRNSRNVFLLNDIFYDFNTNHFSENSIKQIDSLIEILKQYDSLLIRVESLERSSYDYESFNYKLIKSIHMMRYLDSHGIPYKRLLPYQEIPSRVNNKCLNKHYKRHSKEYLFELIDSKAKNDD